MGFSDRRGASILFLTVYAFGRSSTTPLMNSDFWFCARARESCPYKYLGSLLTGEVELIVPYFIPMERMGRQIGHIGFDHHSASSQG